MLKDKAGNRLFRRVDIKIIYPNDVFPIKTISQRAGPKQGFGPNGIDDILMKVADELDTKFPWWEFEMVEIAPRGRTAFYVFKFHSYRPQPAHEVANPESVVMPEDKVVPNV